MRVSFHLKECKRDYRQREVANRGQYSTATMNALQSSSERTPDPSGQSVHATLGHPHRLAQEGEGDSLNISLHNYDHLSVTVLE